MTRHTSVPHTLHIGNSIQKKSMKDRSLGKGLLANPYLSSEYYIHSAMALHPKFTI